MGKEIYQKVIKKGYYQVYRMLKRGWILGNKEEF